MDNTLKEYYSQLNIFKDKIKNKSLLDLHKNSKIVSRLGEKLCLIQI
ncbi:9188_t:CDS:1, partial [Gigaspora margarita]